MNLQQRVAKIKTVADLDKQLSLAKAYVMRMRTEGKKAVTLEEKLALQQRTKEAEQVMRKLRHLSFDIEDALAENKSPMDLVA